MTNRPLNRPDRPDRRTYRNVAELVRAFRACDLFTQHELARRTGVTQAQLCRYEKGVQEPSLPTLRRMLDGLGWTLRLAIEPSTAESTDCSIGRSTRSTTSGWTCRACWRWPRPPSRTERTSWSVARWRAAIAAHHGLTERDDHSDQLEIHRGDVVALVAPTEVLPASRLVRLDFRSYLSGREVPVVDLDVVRDSGVLGPSGRALVGRMAERTGAESIP